MGTVIPFPAPAPAWLKAVRLADLGDTLRIVGTARTIHGQLDDVPRFIKRHAADLLDVMEAAREESYTNESAYERGVAFEYNHGRL